MTVALTSNFFSNARGLTLLDGGGISWSINKSTNAITATGSGGGVLSSVGLTDASTAPIYTVGNSPLTANGAISLTLKNQTAATVFAGPGTGAAAQPGFRALVATDIPTIAYSSLSGTPSIPAAANPSGLIGMSAVNGVATTFTRSDATHAIDPTISPTFTGNWTLTPGSGIALTINGVATSVSLNAISAPYFCTNNGKPALQMNSAGSNYGVVGNISSNLWGLGTTASLNGAFTSAVQWNASNQVGFNTTAPIAKPTITGSKGANAALASLLTALANYGLVTDSTT